MDQAWPLTAVKDWVEWVRGPSMTTDCGYRLSWVSAWLFNYYFFNLEVNQAWPLTAVKDWVEWVRDCFTIIFLILKWTKHDHWLQLKTELSECVIVLLLFFLILKWTKHDHWLRLKTELSECVIVLLLFFLILKWTKHDHWLRLKTELSECVIWLCFRWPVEVSNRWIDTVEC